MKILPCHHLSDTEHVFFPLLSTKTYDKEWRRGFPGGTVIKNLPANAGDRGLIPGP